MNVLRWTHTLFAVSNKFYTVFHFHCTLIVSLTTVCLSRCESGTIKVQTPHQGPIQSIFSRPQCWGASRLLLSCDKSRKHLLVCCHEKPLMNKQEAQLINVSGKDSHIKLTGIHWSCFQVLLPSVFVSFSCMLYRLDDHRFSTRIRPEIMCHPVIAEGQRQWDKIWIKLWGGQRRRQSFLFHRH